MGVVAAMLCVASSALAAPGINLMWTSCAGEGDGAQNRTFACAANTGTNQLVVSFELPSDLAQVSGNEFVVDFLTTSAVVPAWWHFKDPGTCRQGSLAVNVTFDANDVVCVDWAQGGAIAGIGSYTTNTPPSMGSIDPSLGDKHRRLTGALAVAPTALQDLVTGTEYFACNLTINNAKTVGTGSCAGCDEAVCIVLNSVNVTTPVLANDIFIGNASSPGSNIVTWQGTGPDCQSVPVKNTTWGAVKALYR
jgi:hypothetical protein